MANKTVNWIEELAKYNAANNVSVLNTLPTKVQDDLVMRIATETAKLLRAADQKSGNFPLAPSSEVATQNDIIVLPDVPVKKTKSPEVAVRELISKINQRKAKAGKTYVFQDGTVDKGVHAVWDGYNDSLRNYYGEDMDVVAFTSALATAGVVKVTPAKGGVKIYLPEDYQPKKSAANIIKL